MSNENMNLLPCPYCHKTTQDIDPDSGMRAIEATTYSHADVGLVKCNWCGLSGPVKTTFDEAVTAWNSLPRKQP